MSRSALLVVVALALPIPARAQDLIAVDYSGIVYRIDSATGAIATLGSSGMGHLNSAATAPDGTVYAGRSPNSGAPTAPQIVQIDPQTAKGTATALATKLDFRALAARPDGLLYAIIDHEKTASGQDELFLIDPVQLTAISIGSTGLTALQGLARAPDGTLYAWDVTVNNGPGLVRIDPLTGMATDVNPTVGYVADMQFLAFRGDGTLLGGRYALFALDTATGMATQIGAGGYPDLRGADTVDPVAPCALSYGSGCAGSGGFVPQLDTVGCPVGGGLAQIAVSQGLGGAGGLLLVGLAPAAVPMPGPCTLNVTPVLPLIVPFPLSGVGPGNGSIVLFGTLPPAASGSTFTMQAFIADPAHFWGFAASNGLQLTPQ